MPNIILYVNLRYNISFFINCAPNTVRLETIIIIINFNIIIKNIFKINNNNNNKFPRKCPGIIATSDMFSHWGIYLTALLSFRFTNPPNERSFFVL